ncbi:MAG: polysaccharide deacetylase family protein [Candidatus Sulfotelmatobacter sp.]
MNFRSQARALLIQAANLARLDSLAFYIQKLEHRAHALVVTMHETPASLQAQFCEQLEFASQHFTIASLEEFAKLWARSPESEPTSKPLLLFTFDDGRESNYSVAAPLLESFGGRGVFFVVPAFAECAATEQALSFYRTRINPDSKPGDEIWEDWKPMSAVQVADLADRGHAIGNHTLTHERLLGLSPDTLEREIGDSARKLASWTRKPVDAFAWTFDCDAIDASARKMIRRYHRFCFSPCPGVVDSRHDSPHLLWRREIEVRYSRPQYRFCYSGLVDLWWGRRRRMLRNMLRDSSA